MGIYGSAFTIALEQAATTAYYLSADDFQPPAHLADSSQHITTPFQSTSFLV
jgi:hypothetical protein